MEPKQRGGKLVGNGNVPSNGYGGDNKEAGPLGEEELGSVGATVVIYSTVAW